MNDLTQLELWELRAIIQRVGWGKFMLHIGSLMAEQADKVKRDSEQDKALASCSITIHRMNEFFQKCGFFDYTMALGMIDEKYHDLLIRNKPGVTG